MKDQSTEEFGRNGNRGPKFVRVGAPMKLLETGQGMLSVATVTVLVHRQTVVTGTAVHGSITMTRRDASRFHYGVNGRLGDPAQ